MGSKQPEPAPDTPRPCLPTSPPPPRKDYLGPTRARPSKLPTPPPKPIGRTSDFGSPLVVDFLRLREGLELARLKVAVFGLQQQCEAAAKQADQDQAFFTFHDMTRSADTEVGAAHAYRHVKQWVRDIIDAPGPSPTDSPRSPDP